MKQEIAGKRRLPDQQTEAEIMRTYFAEMGRKGGSTVTEKASASRRRNLAKARLARWEKWRKGFEQ